MKTNPINHFSILFLLSVIFIHLALARDSASGIKPKDGFVPDEKTALKIAEAVALPIIGKQLIELQTPLKVKLSSGEWVVTGDLRQPTNSPYPILGGGLTVRIEKATGCIKYFAQAK
jgi:hypothetical protein